MSKWILCNQKLPEDRQEVFLVDYNNSVRRGAYILKDKSFDLYPVLKEQFSKNWRSIHIDRATGDIIDPWESQRSIFVKDVICWQLLIDPRSDVKSPFKILL